MCVVRYKWCSCHYLWNFCSDTVFHSVTVGLIWCLKCLLCFTSSSFSFSPFSCFFSQMQKLYIILTFLSSLCFHTAVPLTECNDTTQYAWPMANPTRCCNKCLPGTVVSFHTCTVFIWTGCFSNQLCAVVGQQMRSRSAETCDIKCVPCSSNQFSDSHNVEMDCTICNSCSKRE